ncbi:MAG: CpsD/CapB family tyrosine-protein kinase [Chloroflexi bacterium]|jgi:capsular exopolysaccharide synthesis family protein|nr:CpsD/CapB family tyrosine-protein kinase [Chloroflexota bacterium]
MENLTQTKHIQSILVTSTRTYINNASIAADLAAMVAQTGKKTLLMDADLNRPVIHRVFELPNRVGLSDVLQGQRDVNGIMHSLINGNLHVITSGIMPTITKDLIGTKEMSNLIKTLKQDYEKIFIHGPAFFYNESTLLASQVDGVVLLINPSYAKSEATQAIVERFQKTGATIVGIVMRDQPKYQSNQSAFINRLLSYDKHNRVGS